MTQMKTEGARLGKVARGAKGTYCQSEYEWVKQTESLDQCSEAGGAGGRIMVADPKIHSKVQFCPPPPSPAKCSQVADNVKG